MNFQINVDSLKTALKIAQKAMDKNENLPVRTYFHVSLTDDGHVVILASGQLFSVTLKLTPDCIITHGEPILLSTKAIKYLDKLDVEEVKKEGDKMHHCVFTNEYYKRDNSLLMSARDASGNRIETIELDLKTLKVLQSRGVNNSKTDKHDEILSIIESNINKIKALNYGK